MPSFTQSYDYTSGPDAAYKASQEKSQLEAAQAAALYDGDPKSFLSSENRIRDLQKYLLAYGADPSAQQVIPGVRLERKQVTREIEE